jgi:hypothetical protein
MTMSNPNPMQAPTAPLTRMTWLIRTPIDPKKLADILEAAMVHADLDDCKVMVSADPESGTVTFRRLM